MYHFADHYLAKHALFKPFIYEKPDNNTGIIVCIPAYNEPTLIPCFESLLLNNFTLCHTEVIAVVNCHENAPPEIKTQNLSCYDEAKNWIKNHKSEKISFHCLLVDNLNPKNAGVGLARKIVMDEAVYRFNAIGNSAGIIACFDADAYCDNNYLEELYLAFGKGLNAASIYFEHPLEGEFDEIYYRGIALYELHLRYYIHALRFCGFPYAFHTIGSAMAVNVTAYCKQGGMNQKKAGEDFYLLQKIIPLGNFGEINSTRIIPSPRISDRVPFGTGATMKKFICENTGQLKTYSFELFKELKLLFSNIELLYKNNNKYNKNIINNLPDNIYSFCLDNNIIGKLDEINQHCASLKTFKIRFYTWFNAFRVMKFLNYARDSYYGQQNILEAAGQLVDENGQEIPSTALDLLKKYRQWDKTGFNCPADIKY